jgi:hypothetical protein
MDAKETKNNSNHRLTQMYADSSSKEVLLNLFALPLGICVLKWLAAYSRSFVSIRGWFSWLCDVA